MKRLLICLAILALSTSTSTGNSADKINQWSACGPWSHDITALALDPLTPSTLYAGTYRFGVYKSTDAGSSWTRTSSFLGGSLVRVIVIDPLTPSTLYAGTFNSETTLAGGVYKSTDGGSNWTASNTGLNTSNIIPDIRAMVVDPLTPSTLYMGTAVSGGIYVGTDAGGVYKSMDGGDSWTAMNNGLPTLPSNGKTHIYDINTLAIDPLTPSTLYAGTDAGIYKSTDRGTSWTVMNSTGDVLVATLAIDPLTPSTLYAGTRGKGIYKSTDAGNNWTSMNNGLPTIGNGNYESIYSLIIDPLTPLTLFAYIDGHGVIKSTDAGSSWNAMNSGLPTYGSEGKTYFINALSIDPLTPSTLYTSVPGHVIFKSTDAGSSWISSNTGLPGDDVASLAIDPFTPSTLYAGISGSINQYHFGVIKSTDGGDSWSSSSGDLAASSVKALAIDPITPSTLYAATGVGVYKSTNGGDNWTASITGVSLTVRVLVIDPTTPSTLYAGADGSKVLKSMDGGSNWTEFNNGLPTLPPPQQGIRPGPAIIFTLVIDPLTTSTLYAGTDGGGVFKSTDAGRNWIAMNDGLPTYTTGGITYTESIYTMAIDPLTPFTLYAGTSVGGVYKSTDSGRNWSARSTGLPGDRVASLAIDPLTTSTLYAGTDGGGVFKSTDAGRNWIAMNDGLPTYTTGGITYTESIFTLAIDPLMPSTLYAGTSNGVYFYDGAISTPGDGGGNHSGSSGSGCFISAASP